MIVTIAGITQTDTKVAIEWQTDQQPTSTATARIATTAARLDNPATRFTVNSNNPPPDLTFIVNNAPPSEDLLPLTVYYVQCEADGNLSAKQAFTTFNGKKRMLSDTEVFNLSFSSDQSLYLNDMIAYCQDLQTNETFPPWTQTRINRCNRLIEKLGL